KTRADAPTAILGENRGCRWVTARFEITILAENSLAPNPPHPISYYNIGINCNHAMAPECLG
ncbi:hypothetical protein, partial [Limnospira fusiformis]|uniref:hypothetical protein n=1 Tax=Limnospira fusiformis TaxID=54297 RepID=UPI002AA24791|nr:hypothetical protein [Limnospira fusiformis LS22]